MTAQNAPNVKTSSNESSKGSQPLKNSRHEAFACAWAAGSTVTDAAWAAGYSDSRARNTGADLGANRGIRARKAWLQAQAATTTVLTIREKREFCARVVRARLSELPDNSDLWQEIHTTADSVKRKLPAKLDAIKQDNDLAGDGSEAGAMETLAQALRRRASR